MNTNKDIFPGTPNANNVRAYTRKYTFDKLGNIQQLKQLGTNGFTRNFTYNIGGNTLQKVETPTPTLIEGFTYDNCGNQLTAGTTRNYVWNAGNQLITYYNKIGSADPTIFAQYDYSGMDRVSKLVKTGSSANPIYERTIYIDGIFEYCILENGTTYEKNYIHIMDDQSRIAMVRVGTPFPDDIADAVTYSLENQIGSSVARLDNNGTLIDKEEFYPFGDSSLRTFTKKRYRYVGREKDLESGLYYYGARYYLAWTCRFISVDPLSAKYAQLNPYNYADNNPINDFDIDGQQNTKSSNSEGSTPQNSNTEKGSTSKVTNNTSEYYMNNQGFFIEGDSNFGEYVGNVKPTNDHYKEIEKINNRYYHKNTSNLGASIQNYIFGTNEVEKKSYNRAEESFNQGMLSAAEFYVSGVIIGKVLGYAGQLLKSAGNSLWKVAPLERGFVYEKMLNLKGAFKSSNFPVIDAFYNGVATSIKTLDVKAASYLKTNAVYNKLVKYADDLYKFEGETWGGQVVAKSQIKSKVLEVGIPRGASKAQVTQINNAIKYAESQGIKMNVRIVK